MSLAQLFYLKETFRESVRRWRHACFRRRSMSLACPDVSRFTLHESRFMLESLEPRLLLSATPTEVVDGQALEPAAVTVPAGTLPSLDVDLNGQADALSDGIVIIRHLFGFTGNALIDGAVDPLGQRTDPTAIQNYLTSISSALDVDLNQQADALSDGIVIIRSLFGFSGNALTDGAIDPGGQRIDPAVIATFLDNMNPQRELIAPLVTAGLQQDTGISATDTITFNPTITGTIADINQIATFTAGFDATPVANFTDILADLQPDGTFGLSTLRLSDIFGGTLADGAHTLHLRATDARGNLTTVDRSFTVDRVAPLTPTFDLALTSDTGVLGDQETTAAIVTLKGQTDPNVQTQLLQTGAQAAVTGTGTFQLPDVALTLGANPFTIRASDVAGNRSEFSQTLTRIVGTQTDVVLTWNQLLLDAIKADATPPPMASRAMAMEALAVYDTISAIEGTPGYYVTKTAVAGTSIEAAVAAAAHDILAYLYPAQQTVFDTALTAILVQVPDGAGETNGLTLGQSIAADIIAIRNADGWDDFVDYVPGNQPGEWQPTAPMFDVALLPQWADLTPFAMTSSDQFTPAGPPALDSAAYTAAFNEVKALGSAIGSTRTADQTQIARFWADGPGTYTPPGHWNRIATEIAQQQGLSSASNARLFAQLNVALADAAITSWNTKYQHEFWRPITAIQQADLDGNAATAADSTWTSLLITPPFPEYTSGHSTFSGAAAEILTSLFGANVAFSTTSVGLPGVTRTFTSFEQAAQEAGKSRIYGGIHFEFSNQDGLASGKSLAQYVVNRFTVTADTQAPTILLDQVSGTVTDTNPTITGRVLDNLSGVAALQAKLDSGAFAPVTLSSTGAFSVPTTLLVDGTADGLHTVTFQAADNQGNSSSPLVFNFTLDTTAPTITLTAPSASDVLTVASRLAGNVSGTGTAITRLTYAFDGGTAMPMSIDPISGVIDEPLDLSMLNVGNHTLTVTAMDGAGNSTTTNVAVSLAALIPLTIVGMTPASGASDVGSTFHPQVFFSRAVNPATLTNNNFFATDSAGTTLAATIVPSQDGTFAWLFFTNPMPGGETITIHVDGATILGAADGQALDTDANGTPGGTFTSTFSTVSLIPIPGTTITGRVIDPGPDLKPMTFDDIRAGADGILHSSDDVFLNPIANVKVFIVGLESQAVFTDAQGNFTLTNVPAGNVKVAVDGRTATNAPPGVFFPEMVMDSTIEPGLPNTLMGSMGTAAEQRANETRGEVYLPRLESMIFTTVSNTEQTVVGLNAASAPDLTAEEAQRLFLTVPPNSAVGTDGQPIADVQIGISTVPPEMIRDMLPPGIQDIPNTITIQARGPNGEVVDRFAAPLAMSFPNIYNAAPGSKMFFASFDHTTGQMVIEGTATVSADGLSVTSDPGQGITKPGWFPILNVTQWIIRNIVVDHPCWDMVISGLNIGLRLLAVAGTAFTVTATAPVVPAVLGLTIGLTTTVEVINEIADLYTSIVGTSEGELPAETFYQLAEALKESGVNISKQGEALLAKGDIDGFLRGNPVPRIGDTPEEVAKRLKIYKQFEELQTRGGELSGSGRLRIALGTIGGALLHFLDVVQFYNSVRECYGSGVSASGVEMAASSLGEASGPLIMHLEELLNELVWAMEPYEQGIDMLIGAQLRALLPEVQADYMVSFKDGRAMFFDQDGNAVRDDSGNVIDVPMDVLLDERIRVDSNYRNQIRALFDESRQRVEMGSSGEGLEVMGAALLDEIASFINAELQQAPAESAQELWYRIFDPIAEATILRGYSPSGDIAPLMLGPNRHYIVETYNPFTKQYGIGGLGAAGSGSRIDSVLFRSSINGITLLPDTSVDIDGDGMSDLGEDVIGTRANISDSDGDGISDLAELRAGTDPLGGRPAVTGVLARLSLQGEAKEIVTQGNPTNVDQQTAYVATGSYGLAIVDASRFNQPVVLGQLDLPGDNHDVSVDSPLQIAAVAAGTGGLHVVDVSNPQQPALLRTITIDAGQVEVLGGIAYVSVGSSLHSYDLLTGERLQVINVGGAALTGLAREGNTLYSMDANNALRAITLEGIQMVPRGTVGMPQGGGQLFVGNGIAYVAATNYIRGGYGTADVSDPDNLTLISGSDLIPPFALGGTAVVANGSGRGLLVGNPVGAQSFLDVVDVSNPTNTAQLLTSIVLPAIPFAVAIAGGIAFVADGSGDLVVVNYASFDNQRQAPAVTLTSHVTDVDPVSPGLQVQEGVPINLRVAVTDDVQVRNVEVLVNGQVVANDLAFPWDFTIVAPAISTGVTSLVIQARATDTGGNFGLSAPVTLDLVPDTTGPTLVTSNISEGSIVPLGFRAVQLTFSESIDPATLSGTAVQLIGGTGTAISPQNIQFRSDGKQIQLTFSAPAAGDYTLRIDQAQVKDRAGNAMGAGVLDRHFTVKQFSIQWVGPAGGDWNVAANWSTGVLPTLTDDVYIGPTSSPVTIPSGTITVQSLVSNAALTLSGASLTLNGPSQLNAPFIQSGGTVGGTGVLRLFGTGHQWNGGTWTGGGTTVIAAGAEQTIAGGANVKVLENRAIQNDGVMIESSLNSQFVRLDGVGVLLNNGLFDIRNDHLWSSGAVAGTLNLINTGIVRKGAGSGDFVFGETTLTNTGSIDVASGILAFTSTSEILNSGILRTGSAGTLEVRGATLRLGAGTQVSGTGQLLETNGVIEVQQNVQADAKLVVAGGTLTGTGTLTLTGLGHQWNGGTWTGGGTTVIAVGAELTLGGTPSKVLDTRTLSNAGTLIDASTGGRVSLLGQSVLTNTGLVDLRSNIPWEALTTGPSLTFTNAGTLRRSIGTGTVRLDDTALTNTGTIEVQTGTLAVGTTGGFSNSGEIILKPGTVLAVTGAYPQSLSGSLNIEVGGLLTSQFGRLTATGAAMLNGTLNVSLANGFTPALGDRFRFMTHASRSGAFAATNGLDLGGGLAFQVEQSDPLDLELVTVAAVPASVTVQSSSSGSSEPALTSDGSLAYVQRSWVKEFVSDPVGATDGEDEELLIALPT